MDLINSFTPTAGETFQIIEYGSETGTFSNMSGGTVADDSGRYLFQVIYGATGVTLDAIGGTGAMPEPSAGALLALALAPGAFAVARRSKRRVQL